MSDLGMRGKVAIVTGGGSGIGRATALQLGSSGATVVVAGLPLEDCEAVSAEIRSAGGASIAMKVDVSNEQDVNRMVDDTVEAFGGLDYAFNNAGTTHNTLTTETTSEIWDHVVDVTLKGVFFCCKHEIPAMKLRGGGVIVNSGSTAGLAGFARRSAYCAAKGGVISMSRAIAVECLDDDIRVNVICPGATETAMVKDLYNEEEDPELAAAQHRSRQPLGRLSTPEDIANAVVFLFESSTITGTPLIVDSGYTMI